VASAGPNSPGTAADVGGGSYSWDTPSNAISSNDTRTSFTGSSGSDSNLLRLTNFSFHVPSSSTISGIVVEIERQGGAVSDREVTLVRDGSSVGTDMASADDWPASDAYASYGGPTSLWGTTWTPSQINNPTFGVQISAGSDSGTQTGEIDHVRITVYYTDVIELVGTNSAAATSVAIPAHQAGDLIIISARRANNTAPSLPAGGGTVPTFLGAESGGANTLSMRTAYAIATANNHTSGTWTNASHIVCTVLRGVGGSIRVGNTNSTNAASTQTIVYPSLSLLRSTGTSYGYRAGTRGTADSEVANAPSGAQTWTNQVVQPAGASALIAVHTAAGLTANPTADTVNTTGSAAPYRAHTLEIQDEAYEGTGSFTVGAATLSSSGTFTPPTYTADSDLNVAPATLAGAATFSVGASTAAAELSPAPATLSGSAAHAPPTYAAEAAVSAAPVTLSGSATHTPPTYTASAAVSAAPATSAGSATFSPGTKTASAAVTAAAATLSASGTHEPLFTASASVTVGAATLAGSAEFDAPVYTASAAVSSAPATLAGSATFATVTFTGAAAVSAGAATLSASAEFDAPVYTASAAASAAPATLAGSATVINPTYTAAAAVSAAPATLAGSATHAAPSYTASAAVSAGAATLAGSAAFAAGTKTAAAAVSVAAATLAASATFAAPSYTAAAALSAGAVVIAGAGVFTREGALRLLYGRIRGDAAPEGILRSDATALEGALYARTATSGILGGRAMSIRQSFDCNRGEDVTLVLNHADATNMTGWTLAFEFLNTDYDSDDVAFRKTTSSGITIGADGASTGARATITISSTNTDLAPGTYYWTLSRTDSGSAAVLAYGRWTINKVEVGSVS
jgi:hypothetical protein